MRRVLVPLLIVLACSTASAEKKQRKMATIMAGAAASVSGGVVLSGFVFAQDSKPFNLPVLYTGIGLLMVAPSVGHFYSGQYLTIGMGVRAAATGFAIYTLETQTRFATCDTALSSNEPPCEVFKEAAYPLLGIAAIAFIGGVWYDVLDAGDAADRYNSKHGFMTAPTIMPGPNGPAPGVSISGYF